MIDMAVVGGGLAGGLAALAVRRAHPELNVAIFEAGDSLGGNHRWSWFASDLDAPGTQLMAGFATTKWSGGYDVAFPGHTRHLSSPYRSLASRDFDAALRSELPAAAIRTQARAAKLAAGGVTLASGEHIAARCVIDCRDFTPSAQLRGGFVHPLTSYTLPFAVANALALARHARLPGDQLAALFEDRAQRHWQATRFYRSLGRMLFDAAEPEERYRVFERFYRLREPLIERFYAGNSSTADKLRILSGKPPVSVLAAIRALLGKGSPLVHERSQ